MKSGLGTIFWAMAVVLATACVSAPAKIQDANQAALAGDSDSGPRANDFGATYGPVETFELRPGDCFDADGQTLEYWQVLRVPCDGYFTHRVLDIVLIDQDGDWPGEELLEAEAAAGCDLRTEFVMYPSPDSWYLGDRTLLCLDGSP